MSFRTTARIAAFFLFALAAVARAQAQAQGSTQTTAPPGTESSTLLAAAAAGDAQVQFALGNYYFGTRYVTLDYAEALTLVPIVCRPGNINGKRNLEAFASDLEEGGGGGVAICHRACQ